MITCQSCQKSTNSDPSKLKILIFFATFPNLRQSIIYQIDNGILSFITLKVFLWDLTISVGDVVSDFLQGYTLFNTPGKKVYGAISLGINWIPGLAASIHLISMYRSKLPVQKVILYALILLLFYPIVPCFTFVYLLYVKPKTGDEPISPEFREAQLYTIIIYAITGGIESTIQLIYQVIFSFLETIFRFYNKSGFILKLTSVW